MTTCVPPFRPPCRSTVSCDAKGAGNVGIPSADIIIYVSAVSAVTCASSATILAYAGACYLDAVTDRPVASYVNFCPAWLGDTSDANYNSMLKVIS